MKLWIIYKEGIGFSMVIAEMLQDRLEDYIDVSVGNAKKIDPAFLVEEKTDYLVIGDVISEEIPSLEIQNWLIKYREISKKKNLIVKAISGFYVALTNITVEPIWFEFLQDSISYTAGNCFYKGKMFTGHYFMNCLIDLLIVYCIFEPVALLGSG